MKGISFIKNGLIIKTENVTPVNIKSLPLYDYETFINIKKCKGTIPILTQRGCFYNCSYCSSNSIFKKIRNLGEKKTMKQIEYLLELYEVDNIHFTDDNFLSNYRMAHNIIKKISEYNKKVNIYSRVELISKNNLKCLFPTLNSVMFGIESLSRNNLNFFNKSPPANYKKIVDKTLSFLDSFDICTEVSFIIGTPVDTKKSMIATYNFIKQICEKYKNIQPELNVLVIYPGSPLWDIYLSGRLKLFKAFDFLADISETIKHSPEITPQNYIVENKYTQNELFLSTIITILENFRSIFQSK